MKWIGAILVFTACTGFGLAFADYQKKRLRAIRILKKAVITLRGQILYANAPIGEALKETGERMPDPVRFFFLAVAERLEEGEGSSLREIWKEELGKIQEEWALEKQDLSDFEQFGSELGYLDLSMQEKTLNLYLERLEWTEKTFQSSLDGKVRLCASLGVLSGIFLVIVLI